MINLYSVNPKIMQEAYTWVYKIVESCNNSFHFEGADILIRLFNERYQNVEFYDNLVGLREQKWKETKDQEILISQ